MVSLGTYSANAANGGFSTAMLVYRTVYPEIAIKEVKELYVHTTQKSDSAAFF